MLTDSRSPAGARGVLRYADLEMDEDALDKAGPPLIQTVRGVGYALRLPRGSDD